MAGRRITGITIEIDGKTTKLTKSLESVNGALKQTKSNLKDVEKLLKLDPTNVNLLRQKKKELAKAIDDTKNKLNQEREALKQLKSADKTPEVVEQMERLERQIADDEAALRGLKKEYSNFGTVAKQQLQAVGGKLQEVGASIKETGEKISGVGRTLTTRVTAPIVGAFGAAVKQSADLDTAISRVAALSGASKTEMEELRDTAREMGKQTVFSAGEAADAMQYMALAGWDTQQMIAGLPGILDLATASGEELAGVSDIVTDGLTAFGLTAADSAHFADVLAVAMSSSNTTVAGLGEAFKYVGPVAGSLEYSIEDISLALGLMANASIKGSQAGTSLRNVMQRMAKPTAEVEQAMVALGVSLDDGNGHMYTFREVLDKLRAGMDGVSVPTGDFADALAELDNELETGAIDEETYNARLNELIDSNMSAEQAEKAKAAAMLGGARAMSGILAITNTTGEEYLKLAGKIGEADGAASEMAEKMRDNVGGEFTILKDQLAEIGIQFGDMIVPILREHVIPALESLMTWLQGLDDETKQTILIVAGVAAAIGPVLLVVGGLITAIGTITSAIGGVVSAVGMLFSPIGLIVAAVAAVIAIGVLLYKNWDTIKEKLALLWAAIKGAWNGIKNTIATTVTNIVSSVKTKFDTLVGTVKGIFERVKNAIMTPINAVKDNIKAAIDFIKGLFRGEWNLPHIKVPHFKIDGGELPWGIGGKGRAPSIGIDWYAKGGIFTSPQVIGVGEAGPEGVIPLNTLWTKLDRIADSSSGSPTIINVYGARGQSVDALAAAVEQKLIQSEKRRAQAWR